MADVACFYDLDVYFSMSSNHVYIFNYKDGYIRFVTLFTRRNREGVKVIPWICGKPTDGHNGKRADKIGETVRNVQCKQRLAVVYGNLRLSDLYGHQV